MTYHYDPKARILGTTLGTYRKVLLAWEREGDLDAMPERLGVGMDSMALIVDDAEARGLFGVTDGEYGATPAGKEFLKGVTTRRMTAAQAQGLLDGLLDNVAALNADRRNPLMVERVWLFGSLAQGKPDCGDVDVVVEESGRPRGEDYKPFRRDIVRLAREMGGGYQVDRAEFKDWAAVDYVMARCLYGARRNPRLVNHALWDLQAIGAPCKVVFDRSLGGRVDGPLLDSHPEAVAIEDREPAKGVVPDMSVPAPAVPCSMRIVVERTRTALGLGLFDRGPVGYPTPWPQDKEALKRWMDALPVADGRRFSVVEDEAEITYEGGRLVGEAHVAMGVTRSLEPGRGPTLRLTHADSLCGRTPKTAQVMRLGAILAQACLTDAMKMHGLGIGSCDGYKASLGADEGLAEWAGAALDVASAHLRKWSVEVEAPGPSPALALA